jgi:transposase-like protein
MDLEKLLLSLDTNSKRELLAALNKDLTSKTQLGKYKDELSVDNRTNCPHCASQRIYGHGKFKERIRYRCSDCRRTFTGLTGTTASGIHKVGEFEQFMELMIDGITIRKAATKLKVTMSTIFTWRHKILSSLQNANKQEFTGIVECDDKQLDISEKGNQNLEREPYKRPSDRETKRGISNDKVSIVVACDRAGNKTMQVAKVGRIEAESLEKTIGNLVSKENILCSDSHPSIICWAKSKELEHHTFIANKHHIKNKCYHVQHVNSLDNRYERWVEKFYGISTKYLQNYLNWFVFIEKVKKSQQPIKDLAREIVMNIESKAEFIKIGIRYKELISPTLI